jgi:hypothetical protein
MNYLRENAIIIANSQDENNYVITAKVSDMVLDKLKAYEK